MSYIPTEWKNGDIITSEKLNKIENGIASAGGGTNILFATVDMSTATLDKTWQELANANAAYIILVNGATTGKIPVITTIANESDNAYYAVAVGVMATTGEGGEPQFELAPFTFVATSADGYPTFAV